ncbi:hypothetical protein DUNSADRAFT_5846 [Dunaliella salina]|uniref:Phosphoglycerate mutase n=1 Tax=Dunaliella salina TaxID=3046 RepID=A0ABQ7GPI7_DUNSA|nr:hypothetical protein DUNSADRAFT_5846 [Dunaliella salina]|eukprot:KAF5836515.1 hypothetical protein DUNSADRAFT_5846 [Dunaliella salina]
MSSLLASKSNVTVHTSWSPPVSSCVHVRDKIPRHRGKPISKCCTGYSTLPSEGKASVSNGVIQSNSRRQVLLGSIISLAASTACAPASASLVQFPASKLQNRYILVRAGESYEDLNNGRIARNPAFKTSQSCGLTRNGVKQVLGLTVPAVESLGVAEDLAWIWPSIWQSSYMTAEIIAYELGLGRSQIVPEYSFLDARGLGAYEGGETALVAQQVGEFDALDSLWRPLKGEDGTPHESLQDVLVRVRQVMSICETQYRGDNIILVAPDSDVLSVLQAAALGVDLRQHTRFSLPPGGVRELTLALEPYDASPRQLSCPNPPSCVV